MRLVESNPLLIRLLDSEQHSGISMKFQESTFDDDTPINTIKGKLAVG